MYLYFLDNSEALQYITRLLSVQLHPQYFTSLQLIGFAHDMNVMRNTNRAFSYRNQDLKEGAEEVGLSISVKK
jgi:hypothetical protein